MTRRQLLAGLAASPLLAAQNTLRPNILWITCEDIGPHLHACGDEYSVTPNLDKLCARGSIYMNAWSNAPVCAPARTTIISGLYPPSTGAEHMRSMTRLPAEFKLFPAYLRDAGYYCTNNAKEDYNIEKPEGTWDDSSKTAHWRKRPEGKPFYSVFNLEITHESQIRTRPHTFVHDPAKARIPAYHPDTLEVRRDWAQYYDNITTMDKQAGGLMEALAKDGLADDTIVVFFGDHGSGMPRSKRWPFNSGLNVSIVVSIPEKFKHLAPPDYLAGGKNNRLVGFVDLAPSMLALAGVAAPAHFQGTAFLGTKTPAAQEFSYGFRGRTDERYDCVRSVRDQRFVYIRNYMPHKIYGQHLDYMWQTPTTQVWERLYKEGKLNAAQRQFWETKAPEQLFELATDRDEVNNLAGDPKYGPVLEKLRRANREHELSIRDIGLLPEAEIHARGGKGAPYTAGHDKAFPFERIFAAAELAANRDAAALPKLRLALKDRDSGVRYWAATGFTIRETAMDASLLDDASPSVRIAAAEAIGRYGNAGDLPKVLETLMALADCAKNGPYLSLQALSAIDALGAKAAPLKARIAAMATEDPTAPERVRKEYVTRLTTEVLLKL